MSRTLTLSLCTILMAGVGLASPSLAQDAAESAVILSGTAQTGAAQRSLGRSVSSSMGNAANAVAAAQSARIQRPPSQSRARSVRGYGGSIPANVDPLANTDAAIYALDNGATIKVSGTFNPGAAAHCERNCPAPQN